MVQICKDLDQVKSTKVDSLIVIGTLNAYEKHFDWVCHDVLKVILKGSNSSNVDDLSIQKSKKSKTTSPHQELLQSIVETLKPSDDAGVSTECYLQRSYQSKPLKVILAALPASVSRHNSPAQPYAITSLLKKHVKQKDQTLIVPLCESPQHVLSISCAISRVSSTFLYSKKTDGGRPVTNGGKIDENAVSSPSAVQVIFPFPMDEETHTRCTYLDEGIGFARFLVDAPANELNATSFTEHALSMTKFLKHVSVKVIKGKELDEQGYGGLYGVGKAAIHPPALVILSYEPPSTAGQKGICLVGKGIVFDTGGLQIKTKTGMPGMKRDMGGAAAILATFIASVYSSTASNTASKRPLHAILCLAENAVASHATRADDILTLYSGKTVEINNTDAEGRLVLSDGVAYATRHLDPQVMIDMATLTGAQGVATGKYFGAVYSNDEKLEQIAVEAGKFSGDLCHPVPFAPEFFRPEFKSAVADMKNSVADRANAQVSCAGQFIHNHIPKSWIEGGGQWCHIDMAYCVYDKKDERATGYGVALLNAIIEKLEEDSA